MHLLHHMQASLMHLQFCQHLGSPVVACMSGPSQRTLQRPSRPVKLLAAAGPRQVPAIYQDAVSDNLGTAGWQRLLQSVI